MSLLSTPSQTVGPYFSLGLESLYTHSLVPPGSKALPVTIAGRLFDGELRPVPDAVLELWQADAAGLYCHPEDQRHGLEGNPWRGFGRVPTDGEGGFSFTTIRPAGVPGPAGTMQAPHIVVLIGMRGLLRHLMTRLYFPDQPANADDPILALVPEARRATLIAKERAPGHLEWNLHLQGPAETVFFDF